MHRCMIEMKRLSMVRPRSRQPKRPMQRRGATMIVVIALFAVAVALMGVWIRGSLSHQHQVRRWHQQSQTIWLAESGLRRAAAQLASNPNYEKESWQIDADSLGGNHAAQVDIIVEALEQSEPAVQSVRLTAVALYPVGHKLQNKHTKTIEIDLPITSTISDE